MVYAVTQMTFTVSVEIVHGGMAQVVVHLPNKCKALGSNASTRKERKKEGKREGGRAGMCSRMPFI
jgi:hypothetical protein